MLFWTFVLLFVVLWGIAAVSSHALGPLIHILLAVAMATLLLRMVQNRRALSKSSAPRPKNPE